MQGTWNITNAGTFAVQVDGAALTSLQLLDDTIIADDAAFTPATTKVAMAGFTFDDVAPDSVNEGDAGAARMSANRNIYVNIRDNAGNERGLNVDANGFIGVTDGAGSLTVDNAALSVTGGGVEATALRVTVASDSTGVLSVDDNGGSLTVDGSVAVTNAGTFVVQENGAALTSLQLIDDTVVADDAAFTPATTKVIMAGFTFDDVAPDSVNEGDGGAARMSANRNIYTTLRDAAGNERGANVNASNQLSVSVDNTVTVGSHAVTNAGTFAVQVDGSALTSLQLIDDVVFAEDAAHNTGDKGIPALAMRDDTLGATSGTEGDYELLHTNADGALWTALAPSATGGLSTAMFSGSDGSSILVATAQAVKASAGVLYGYYAYNPEAAVTFVHFYNTAAASVTVGTTNPLFTLPIPAASAANLTIPQGIAFSNAGWSVAATTTAGGNTAPATGVSLVAWFK